MDEMDDRLKQLFDYTKFHIGMYTTLIGAIIGVFGNRDWAASYRDLLPCAIGSVLAFTVAGVFGGLVASSIPYYRTFEAFSNARLGPWRARRCERWRINGLTCTHLEHTAFWAGCLIAIVGILCVMVPVAWSRSSEAASVKAGTVTYIDALKRKCDLYGYVRGTPQHAGCVLALDSRG
ncbi:hypothetical protein [Paraburkholderia acidiphila]|uniref:Transmembrane protein n=1 Tax=Paraburkholderia acidiphila TaxID=2571747 RepID=A0A7Z2G502_9BURK|nr:hypothetical protein [Paraburkholderia acidiphila]QGZ55090.1 hypothetical protein FAZ97_09260 [Paraburkholderia acidiphila]